MKCRGQLQLISDQSGFTNISTEFIFSVRAGQEKNQEIFNENKWRNISALNLTRNLCLFGVFNSRRAKNEE